MNKKIWMSLGATAVTASSVIAVVSCGSNKSSHKEDKTTTQTNAQPTIGDKDNTNPAQPSGVVSHSGTTSHSSSSRYAQASSEVKILGSLPAIEELKGETEYDVANFADAQSQTALKASNIKNTDLTRYDTSDGFMPYTSGYLKVAPYLEGEAQLHVEKSKLLDEEFARKYNGQMSKEEWIKMYSDSKFPVGAMDAYQSAAWHTSYADMIGTKGRSGIGFRFTKLNAPERFESESKQGQEATWATPIQPRLVANPKYDQVKVQVLELKQIVNIFKEAKSLATQTWKGDSKVTYTNTSYGIAKAAAAKLAGASLDTNPFNDVMLGSTPVITYLNFNGHLVELESLKNSFFNIKGYFANQKIETLEELIWNINTFMEITFVHPIVEGLQNITESGSHDKESLAVAYGLKNDLKSETVVTSGASANYVSSLHDSVSDLEFANNPASKEEVMSNILNSTHNQRLTYRNAFEGENSDTHIWSEIMKASHGQQADLSQVWEPVENKMENGKLIRRDDFHAIRNYETNIDNAFQLDTVAGSPIVKKDSTWFRIAKPWKLPMFWAKSVDSNKYPTFDASELKVKPADVAEKQAAAKLNEIAQKYPAEKLFDFHGSKWTLDITDTSVSDSTKYIFSIGNKKFLFNAGTNAAPAQIGTMNEINLAAFLDTATFDNIKAFIAANKAAGRNHFVFTNQPSNPAEAYDVDDSSKNSAMILGWIPFENQNKLYTPASSLRWEDTEAGMRRIATLRATPVSATWTKEDIEKSVQNLIQMKNGNLGAVQRETAAQQNMQILQSVAGAQVYSTFYLQALK